MDIKYYVCIRKIYIIILSRITLKLSPIKQLYCIRNILLTNVRITYSQR